MKRRFFFDGETCHLAEVRRQVRKFLEAGGVPEDDAEVMVLAIDEACTNIIRHAYHNRPGRVRALFERRRRCIRITLRDFGTPCDPSRIRSRDLDDIRPGGVGVHIIRQAFEQVVYLPKTRGTQLTLIKFFPEGKLPGNPRE